MDKKSAQYKKTANLKRSRRIKKKNKLQNFKDYFQRVIKTKRLVYKQTY